MKNPPPTMALSGWCSLKGTVRPGTARRRRGCRPAAEVHLVEVRPLAEEPVPVLIGDGHPGTHGRILADLHVSKP